VSEDEEIANDATEPCEVIDSAGDCTGNWHPLIVNRSSSMITKMPSEDQNNLIVRFELPAAIWADSVRVVGDLDGCNETSHPLVRDRADGR
jgi:hypothetical protein